MVKELKKTIALTLLECLFHKQILWLNQAIVIYDCTMFSKCDKK